MSIGAASLRIRRISFICDVCDVNLDTYEPGAQVVLYILVRTYWSYLDHGRRKSLDHGYAGPSHRRPMLYSAVMNFGVLVCTWTGYNVAFSILISSVQPSTVSVRVFCGPTIFRARGNEVSAMNTFTRNSDSEYVATLLRYYGNELFPAPYVIAINRSSIYLQCVDHK